MSEYLEFTTARRQARANLAGSWLDGGTIRVYSATRPASSDDAVVDQVLLCVFDLATPAGVSTNGIFTGTLPEAAMVLASGVPTWARAFDSSGVPVWDTGVGATGSGNAIELDEVNLIEGSLVAMTTFQVEEG